MPRYDDKSYRGQLVSQQMTSLVWTRRAVSHCDAAICNLFLRKIPELQATRTRARVYNYRIEHSITIFIAKYYPNHI